MKQPDENHIAAHGRHYNDECAECEAVWREDRIKDLRRQAKKLWIEAQFENGMSWGNWGRGPGKWHLTSTTSSLSQISI